MKLAIFTDIHGNYRALQTCLAHAERQDVDAYLFLGDYLGEFPYPQKTMDILYTMRTKYHCFFLRGNKEDYWIHRRKDIHCEWKNGNRSIMSMLYNYENLKSKDIDFFESLPISQSIRFNGMEPILICHGTPTVNNRSLLADDGQTHKMINECSENIIICGHTHMQRFIQNGTKTILNVGAVGVPLHARESTQYMILNSDSRKWKHKFISLNYDVARVISDIHESGLWDASPYWCKITEHLLYTGEISHGTVLNHVMKLNGYKDAWYNIDDNYWDKALRDFGIL